MYIFRPSPRKNTPSGIVSCAPTLKLCKKTAVLTSHAVLRSYSTTLSTAIPITYILVPSGLKNTSVGPDACAATLKLCKKTAVLTTHAVLRSYSMTLVFVRSVTYILVPSGLNVTPARAALPPALKTFP